MFTENVALDYRMGPDWDEDGVVGFFEILEEVSIIADAHRFTHKENLNDGANELFTIWRRWCESRTA